MDFAYLPSEIVVNILQHLDSFSLARSALASNALSRQPDHEEAVHRSLNRRGMIARIGPSSGGESWSMWLRRAEAHQPQALASGHSEIVVSGTWFVCILNGGELYTFGGAEDMLRAIGVPEDASFLRVPRPLQSLQGTTVREVAAGCAHVLVLTADGLVFSWGHGDQGQLGHQAGDEIDNWGDAELHEPTIIDHLAGMDITHVSAGYDKSAAVTQNGTCFTWGRHFDGEPVTRPRPVDALHGVAVGRVKLSMDYALAVSRDGRVFEWGEVAMMCNRSGVDDADDADDTDDDSHGDVVAPPRPIEALLDYHIVQVDVARRCAVAISAGGLLFAWGADAKDMLGPAEGCSDGQDEATARPRRILTGVERLAAVSVGNGHMLAIDHTGVCVALGQGNQGQLGCTASKIARQLEYGWPDDALSDSSESSGDEENEENEEESGEESEEGDEELATEIALEEAEAAAIEAELLQEEANHAAETAAAKADEATKAAAEAAEAAQAAAAARARAALAAAVSQPGQEEAVQEAEQEAEMAEEEAEEAQEEAQEAAAAAREAKEEADAKARECDQANAKATAAAAKVAGLLDGSDVQDGAGVAGALASTTASASTRGVATMATTAAAAAGVAGAAAAAEAWATGPSTQQQQAEDSAQAEDEESVDEEAHELILRTSGMARLHSMGPVPRSRGIRFDEPTLWTSKYDSLLRKWIQPRLPCAVLPERLPPAVAEVLACGQYSVVRATNGELYTFGVCGRRGKADSWRPRRIV